MCLLQGNPYLNESRHFLSVPFSFEYVTAVLQLNVILSFWHTLIPLSLPSSLYMGKNYPKLSENLEWIQSSEAEC